MPRKQASIQAVPPVLPPLLPVVILEIAYSSSLAVVRGLAPGIDYIRPQAGGYEVVQRGYELFDHQE